MVTLQGLPHLVTSGFFQGYVLFPLAIHAMDLIVSGVGIMMTEAPKGKGSKMLGITRSRVWGHLKSGCREGPGQREISGLISGW